MKDNDARKLLRQAEAAKATLADAARPAAVERQRRRARLTARERVA